VHRVPTPVGHALGGLACGWLLGPAPAAASPGEGGSPIARLRANWRRAGAFAILGALPDIDLLFHAHSTYTHSLGAALLVAIVVWPFVGTRMALAGGAAWASHVLLDWLGVDTSPPYGITALWPFSSAYYYSALDWFPAVDRRYWLPGFWWNDLKAVTWELIVLIPITLIVLWLRRPRLRASAHA
jgi:inner membrane protein